tara:strand:+ start:847 stop:1467 length:621 start_codon:yes stop_codon:yes gene_type:complete
MYNPLRNPTRVSRQAIRTPANKISFNPRKSMDPFDRANLPFSPSQTPPIAPVNYTTGGAVQPSSQPNMYQNPMQPAVMPRPQQGMSQSAVMPRPQQDMNQTAVMPDSYNPYNTGLKIDSMNSGGFGVHQLPPQREPIGQNSRSPYGAVDYNAVVEAPSETLIDYSPPKGAVGAAIPMDEELRRKKNRENAEGNSLEGTLFDGSKVY